MPPRHLIGPVTPEFAAALPRARAEGLCLTFGFVPGCDVEVLPGDSWDVLTSRLPGGWRPEFVALDLARASIPAWVWDAPVPVVGLMPRWRTLWERYRCCRDRCELILTDPDGAERMRRDGWTQARGVDPGQLPDAEQTWLAALEGLAGEWPAARERSECRPAPDPEEELRGRVWQALEAPAEDDPRLAHDLTRHTLSHPESAEWPRLHGVVRAAWATRYGPITGELTESVLVHFRDAVAADGGCLLARLCLAEALFATRRDPEAAAQCEAALRLPAGGRE